MSAATAPLTMAERAALASDLADWITEAGGDIKSLSVYRREGDFFGCAIVFQVGGNEAGVDACADLLSLGNPDAHAAFYKRSGTVRGLSVAVFSTRSKPVCTCIAGCHHAAVTA